MKRSVLLKQALLPLALLAFWWWGSERALWSAYVLPSPLKVWRAFMVMAANGSLAVDLIASLRRVAIGFSISFGCAFVMGVAAGWSKRTHYYGPIVEFLRHVPPLSLIPMLILWFGIGEASKTVLIVLATFFPIYMSVKKGFAGANAKLVEVGRTMGFSGWQLFRRIMVPCAVPDVLNGVRIGLGYSWRAIIGAEMIAASSGLGYMVLDAQQMSRSDKVVVGILVIGIVGYVTDKVLAWLIGLIVPSGGDAVDTL